MKENIDHIEDLDVFEIYNYLPKINCKRCGEITCLAFAVKIESGVKKLHQCLVLADNKEK